MASQRRIGTENSRTRVLLLEAAEALMREEGYAAVTSRQVASRAGLKPQLVHYYFRTMDDLFLALLKRLYGQYQELEAAVLASDRPLKALWELSSHPETAVLTAEFTALANHRKPIQAEIARVTEEMRRNQAGILARVLAQNDVDPVEWPPIAVSIFLTGIARVLVFEQASGVSSGHAEVQAIVERWLERLESPGCKPQSQPPRIRSL